MEKILYVGDCAEVMDAVKSFRKCSKFPSCDTCDSYRKNCKYMKNLNNAIFKAKKEHKQKLGVV